ncbi:Holliday junction resolvase RuvX [Helcococcus kunzii]|uniref:Putative pre-16S rRNA nuclease n=1 Tax=Helcococcus kunzii ATCC 51366 TaxID=883114 RepID=H3NNJ7_9FIRM|nr:Holliday junction resolvase RuvX [Helcococcus kunzii]EHR33972.1 RNAse H-fold protein YqgF [Helcococcus kunzii ATCC 51366]MCT1795580.1 Holliday junction resolvase RuvX [Helcococcus kunzii]MCT1989312.1 Holliday junction resolvase RuvX [Helcococcus kunzii]QUY64823.1 Holliday junction resolvase RuvX [Helcococcus kunzii]QZO77264.1 Holliday junction resolvase RuvX [Helcococcus kunzii]
MERYIGLDLGTKTIGVAISDPFLMFANGLVTIKRKNVRSDIEQIKKIIEENEITKVIIGMPYNMDGSKGPSAQRVMSFVDLLKKEIDNEIIYEDERLTTVSAERVLIESNVGRNRRKDHIDKIAAALILQSYLDAR